jgi:hypothetical protein
MKFFACLTTLLLTVALLSAQQFSAKQEKTFNKNTAEAQNTKRAVKIKPVDPVESGALVDLYRRGSVLLSPGAPASAGNGQRYLTTNPFPRGSTTENSEATAREFGGIKLIGIDF